MLALVTSRPGIVVALAGIGVALAGIGAGAAMPAPAPPRTAGPTTIQASLPAAGGMQLLVVDRAEVLEEPPTSLYAPHFPEGGDASERWSYLLSFPTGHVVRTQLMITNGGPGDATCLAVTWLTLPDGEVVTMKNSRRQGDWSHRVDESGFELDIARHRFHVGYPDHELDLRYSEGSLSLHVGATTPLVNPGRVAYPDGGFLAFDFLAPRATATGTLTLRGKEPVGLGEGTGIVVHSQTNLAYEDRVTSSLQLDTLEGPLQLTALQWTTPGKIGIRSLGYLLVFEDGRLVEHTPRLTRRYTGTRRDRRGPGYPIPEGVVLERDGEAPGIRLQADDLRVVDRRELLDLLNSRILRFFLRRVMNPVEYELVGPAQLRYEADGVARTAETTARATVFFPEKPSSRF